MYSIGDLGRILSIKPHVLRYWEQEFPVLSPKKDLRGNRVYSEGDLHLLCRIKHLLYEKKFTLEGARRELWRSLEGPSSDLRIQVSLLRSDLLNLKAKVVSWDALFTAAAEGSSKKMPILEE